MEKIKREDFETWVNGNNWLKTDEAGTPDGQQIVYLTPTGEFIYVQYNLKREVDKIFKRVPVPVQASSVSKIPGLKI